MQTAQFARTSFWPLADDKKPRFLRGALLAFEADFCPPPQFLAQNGLRDLKNHARQIGFVEVLLIAPDELKNQTPLPTQKTSFEDGDPENSPSIYWQRRRLIVPENAREDQMFRATVPLQLDSGFPSGLFRVFTRIVPLQAGQNTPWTLTDKVRITHK